MNNELRHLQLTMLEMLKLVDKICRENNIQYSLCSGTLLGAVRHKGFIPWDDDLDIRMTRENYDKFLEVWSKLKPEGYFLQNKENSPRFSHSFSKVRKEHTAFVQKEKEKGIYHTGIFIDIFPLDRIPKNRIKKSIFKFQCIKYQIYTRENLHAETNKLIKAFIFLFLKTTSFRGRMESRKKFVNSLRMLDMDKTLNCIGIETPSMLKIEFPPNIAEEYVELPFEDGKFMCFKKWHEYLMEMFGDYMTLPPENQRIWQHHPIILDFERDYDELMQLQKESENKNA